MTAELQSTNEAVAVEDQVAETAQWYKSKEVFKVLRNLEAP